MICDKYSQVNGLASEEHLNSSMSIPGDVTAASAEETRQLEDQIYDFQQCTVPHIPRAWERAPKSSFAPQHKGRKVWKRYELRATEADPTLHEHPQRRAGDLEEGLRPIKRRRAKQVPEARDLPNTQTPPRFFTTLREQPYGTPRRKVTKRTSLKGGRSIPQIRQAPDSQSVCKDEVDPPDESLFGTSDKNEFTSTVTSKTGSALPIEEIGDDDLLIPLTSQNPNFVQESFHPSTRNSQNSEESPITTAGQCGIVFEDSERTIEAIQEENVFNSCKEASRIKDSIETQYRETSSEKAMQPGTQRNLAKLDTPVEDGVLKDHPPPRIDCQENATMPIGHDIQMEVSNLGTSADPEDSHSSEVQQLYLDVCTSTVILYANGLYDTVIDHLQDLTSKQAMSTRHPGGELSPPSTKLEYSKGLEVVNERTSEITGSDDNAAGLHPQADNEGHVMQTDSSTEHPEAQGVENTGDIRVPDNVTSNQADLAPTPIVKEEFTQGRTRSGARFSDDTSMLKDFLNRAQAKKAAVPRRKAETTRPAPVSPRRSPRKVLGQLDNNSPTPARSRDLEKRLDTPVGRKTTEDIETDEIGDELADPISCRRSTRTRLPAPAKKSAGAPSFIPVRRVDGTDPVILQKSIAQELATVTRTNTRRNKGESRAPKLMLPDMVEEASGNVDVTKQPEGCTKMVSWDERLAYYQDAEETKEGKGESRPKVRRLRGLGAANGTPAAKKVVMDMATPGPRRPGRSRG